MANTQKRRIGLLSALVLCASFTGLAAPTRAQAQQEPTIAFINPSNFAEDGAMPVVSDRSVGDDGEEGEGGTRYRLSAWVGNPPPNPLVEFEIVIGINSVTIGTATQRGPNTFEFQWDVSEPPLDGQFTLRALLFSGSGLGAEQVGSVEQEVLIRSTTGEDMKAPAADVTYPTIAGPGGFYVNPTTGASNIVDDFEFSADTTFVATYYTVSPPGEEPAWKQCAGSFVQDAGGPAGSSRSTCSLESIDQGGQFVTAVGVVANNNPETIFRVFNSDFNQAGDAVTVDPYVQDVTSVTTDEASLRVDPAGDGSFGCSDGPTVRLSDQMGRPVSGASVDVHAQGPSDQLKFGVTLGFLGANSAPDQGNHALEPQFNCTEEQEQVLPNQGDHNLPGLPDIKHVEGNSGTSGTFGDNLHTDRAGSTQLTFWADEDGNDVFCSEEPAVAGSMGWGEDPPAPALMSPTETDCPIPDPPDPNQIPECSDGVDNDGDGETDHPEDDGCDSPEDNDETDEGEDPRACTIEGTDDSETIDGTEDDDVICGNGGDDVIDGMGGNDVIFGDGGGDEIRGGPGDDTIHGGGARDTLRGGPGNDTVRGNRGNDTIVGAGGGDDLNGNLGADTLRGGGGGDILKGGVGRDVLTGGAGGDTFQGGRGIDTIKGRRGPDILRGGRHNDNLRGGRGNDSLNGGPGRDTCRGGAGRDRTVNCER